MRIIYKDNDIIVCVKPARVLSTDEPGGMPELVRDAIGNANADIRTVHRLDRVVSGLMVLARSKEAASVLGKQIQDGDFNKKYLAVARGSVPSGGTMTDLLIRDKARRMTFVTETFKPGAQEAILNYTALDRARDMTLVRIELVTGRTHQIRCQFASRGYPLVGERKYAISDDKCEIALLSHALEFNHPRTGERLQFRLPPPEEYPWDKFKIK
jgi:23S rRNA pseudouridine1911/1915/1917 synthase